MVYTIGVLTLLFVGCFLYGKHIDANHFDDALERSNKDIAIIERDMIYISFKEESFLKTVRYGDVKSYYLSLRYGLGNSNPDIFSELKNLDVYCDSLFSSHSAHTILEGTMFRNKEKEAFSRMKKIAKEFCTMDLIHNSPEETQRRIKELLEKWRESKRVLDDRMISSHKRFYLLNEGRYE